MIRGLKDLSRKAEKIVVVPSKAEMAPGRP